VAVDDDGVHRYGLARPDPQPVALDNVFKRRVIFIAIRRDPPGGLGRQIQQRADSVAGPLPGSELQHLSDEDQRDDHHRRLEIDRHVAAMHLQSSREQGGKEGRDRRIKIGRTHADHDQRPHVEIPGPDRRPAAMEERPCRPQHHGRRQREFQIERQRFPQPLPDWQPQHRRHGQHQQRNGSAGADPEPAGEIDQLMVRAFPDAVHRLQRHAADRAGARPFLHDLGVHRTGVHGVLRCRLLLSLLVARQVEIGIAPELVMAAGRAEMKFRPLIGEARFALVQRHAHAADRILDLAVDRHGRGREQRIRIHCGVIVMRALAIAMAVILMFHLAHPC